MAYYTQNPPANPTDRQSHRQQAHTSISDIVGGHVQPYYVSEFGYDRHNNDMYAVLENKRADLDNYITNVYGRFGGYDTEAGQYLTNYIEWLQDNIGNSSSSTDLVDSFVWQNPMPNYLRRLHYSGRKALLDIARKSLKISRISAALNGSAEINPEDLEDDVDEVPVESTGGVTIIPVNPGYQPQPVQPVQREPLIPIGSMPIDIPVDNLVPGETAGLQGGIRYVDRPGSPQAWQQWMKDMRKKGFTDDEIMQLMNSYMAGYRSGGKLVRRK